MSKETQIRQECCDIWNKLKDKTKMIDYLIESKRRIAELEEQLNNSEQSCLICHKDQENEQLKKYIAELEEQLKNAIVPKFKLYDTVYTINIARADGIESGKITQINFDGIKIIYQFTLYQTNYCHTYNYKDEKDVFATKEEAQAKLEELRGENK